MKIFKILYRESMGLFLVACVSSIATGISSTLVIKSIHEAVTAPSLGLDWFFTRFLPFWLSYGLMALVASYSVSRITKNVIQALRMKLSGQILNARYASIENNKGKLLPLLTEDVNNITYNIDRLPGVTTGLASIIGLLAYMVWFSPLLSLLTVLIFCVVFVVTRFSLPYVKKYSAKARQHLDQLYTHFEGLVYGTKELTLNRNFGDYFLEQQIVPESERQSENFLKENIVSSFTNRVSDLILMMGMALIIVMIVSTSIMEREFFGNYLTLVLFTLAPLSTAAGFLSSIKRIEVSLERIESVGISLEAKPILEMKLEEEKNNPIISLLNLSMTYIHFETDQPFTLGPINLEIAAGEIVYIVGGNGSGKTTLGKVICGLYDTYQGNLRYFGQLLDEAYLQNYRSKFAAVFTDSYVFLQTGNTESDHHQSITSWLEKMHLSNKVSYQKGFFSTKNLSDGQKKRLSLIRALIENKRVYLFDEWAANQDPVFKEVFYHEILPYLKSMGKTVIVITHDDRYFHIADHLVKLEEGKIVADIKQKT